MTFVALSLLLCGALALNCAQGAVTNAQSECMSPKYIEGCFSYKDENHCHQCDFRYTLKETGLCEYRAPIEGVQEECCATRTGDGSCVKCKAGLFMIDGKCTESNILGCLERDSLGECVNCAEGTILNNIGFNLFGGRCDLTVKNCVKFSDSQRKVCTECAHGYSLYSNICVMNSILGCKNEVDHICKECYKPFKLQVSGDCKIENCKTYNDYKCVACECGFFLAPNGICKRMQTGCVRYQRGECTDCLPNFTLKGSTCEIEGCIELQDLKCKVCNDKYLLEEGACTKKNLSSQW